MGYEFKGKREPSYKPFVEDGEYTPFSEKEARAKFKYFRNAEALINGGPSEEPEPILTRLRGELPECGTYSGYARHIRLGETPDLECRHAMSDYQREYRARKKLAA